MAESGPKKTAPSRADSSPPAVAAELRRADSEKAQRLRSLAVAVMLPAALFSGVLIGVMAVAYFSEPATPPDSPMIQSLAALLRKDPGNESLKAAYQEEDLRLREEFQTHRRRMAWGAWMLLIGLAVTLTCAKFYASLDRATPRPSTPAERADADRWLARRRQNLIAVAAVGAIVFVGLLVFGLVGGPGGPGPVAAEPPGAPGGDQARPSIPSEDRQQPSTSPAGKPAEALFKDNWPRFRGPDGTGVVQAEAWPQKWDTETGENIVWKTAIPTPGNSSPVLWGKRVFLTGADRDRQEVLCFDRASGKLLWRTPIFARRGEVKPDDIIVQEETRSENLPATTYASPTAATDGERVYATFASADIAAVDFAGNVVWARNLGKPESSYGRATSLLVFKDRVIVQFDRGQQPEEGLSALLALDAKTGKTIWSTPRPVRECWCTPILAAVAGRTELITNGSPWTLAYDPENGVELWRCAGMQSDVAASPTFAGGLVYVSNANAAVFAIRPGAGDVTKTNIVWTGTDGMCDASSPACDGKFFLQANSEGRITCYDAGTGKLLWEKILGCAIWASPTLVGLPGGTGNLAYVPGDDGKVYIFPVAGDKPDRVATCDLGEPLRATPAFADGRIYFRGKKSLFCVGSAGNKP